MSKQKPDAQSAVTPAEVPALEENGPEVQKENPPDTRPTKARVLSAVEVDGVPFQPNDLIEAHADVIESLSGQVDTHPDAVAYCEANR